MVLGVGFFFFQAEDGILDWSVTGVQTCALPISGKTVPSLDGRAITLLDLATHSAGLPREIGPPPEGRSSLTFPSREELWDYVCSTPLLWPPATIAAYSNVGFQLLGEALAAA